MLWGWAPGEVHTHEYDDTGHLVRTTVEREPEFDAEQRDMLVALHDYEASLNELGFLREETMTADADPGNRDGSHRFVASSGIDWSLYALDQAQKAKSGPDDAYGRARKFTVERVDR